MSAAIFSIRPVVRVNLSNLGSDASISSRSFLFSSRMNFMFLTAESATDKSILSIISLSREASSLTAFFALLNKGVQSI